MGVDAGLVLPTDLGVVADASASDATRDAAAPDAGEDAATDTGEFVTDAGSDAGAAEDSGVACETLLDDIFVDADWEAVGFGATGGVTIPSQEMSGGNPGAYRRLETTLSSAGTLYHIHTRDDRPFVPGRRGMVTSIDAQLDAALFDSGGAGQSVVVALAIKQYSSFYWTGDQQPLNLGGWATRRFTALSDFVKIQGLDGDPMSPDGSTSAPKMEFGFIVANSGDVNTMQTIGVDNFSVTVCYQPL